MTENRLKKIKLLFEIIQIIIISLSIIIGAGWAVYSFIKLNESDINNATLTKLQRENKDRISINIEINPRAIEIDSYFLIVTEVTVENLSTKNIDLDLSDQPFSFSSVGFDVNEAPKFEKTKKFSVKSMNSIIYNSVLFAGEKKHYSFSTKIKTKGLYFFEFRIMLKDIPNNLEKINKNAIFFGSKYLHLGSKND